MAQKKFKKRPVEVEAVQFTGGAENATSIVNWLLSCGVTASWTEAYDAWENEDKTEGHPASPEHIRIELPASMSWWLAYVGDWVVRDDKGTFHLLTSEAFNSTYGPVTSAEPIDPGFYRYSGGNQSTLFLRDIHGQWWAWFDNAGVTKCNWGYIEQALGVWRLVRIVGEEDS